MLSVHYSLAEAGHGLQDPNALDVFVLLDDLVALGEQRLVDRVEVEVLAVDPLIYNHVLFIEVVFIVYFPRYLVVDVLIIPGYRLQLLIKIKEVWDLPHELGSRKREDTLGGLRRSLSHRGSGLSS